MKQELYHHINSMLNNRPIAILLSEILYVIIELLVTVRSLFINCNKVELPEACEARNRVNSFSKKPVINSEKGIIPECDSNTMLSIIVPVYNYEKVLRECVDSIINQKTEFIYEIILIDDGATDSSGKIIDEYMHNSKVKIIHKQNSGISDTRNVGIVESIGKYITFVDCDDLIHEDFVDKMVNQALITKCDIVQCGYHFFRGISDEKNSKKYVFPYSCISGKTKKYYMYPGLPWGKIYKREIFEQIRFPIGYWFEDTILHFLVFPSINSMVYIPEDLYAWRRDEGNFTNKQAIAPKTTDHYWVVEYLLEEARKIGLPMDKIQRYVLFKHLGSYLCNGIAGLDNSIREALFVMACDLWNQYRGELPKLTVLEKIVLVALENYNFSVWNYVCRYI